MSVRSRLRALGVLALPEPSQAARTDTTTRERCAPGPDPHRRAAAGLAVGAVRADPCAGRPVGRGLVLAREAPPRAEGGRSLRAPLRGRDLRDRRRITGHVEERPSRGRPAAHRCGVDALGQSPGVVRQAADRCHPAQGCAWRPDASTTCSTPARKRWRRRRNRASAGGFRDRPEPFAYEPPRTARTWKRKVRTTKAMSPLPSESAHALAPGFDACADADQLPEARRGQPQVGSAMSVQSSV